MTAGSKRFTFQDEDGQWLMKPTHLRAIRMDLGMNMTAMGLMLGEETNSRISRNRYRAWERPRTQNQWPYVPRHIAEAAERCHNAFLDFIDTLVSMYDGESPLVMIHRNDMFEDAQLPLPPHISVNNYNQAVGRAWSKIREQGYDPDLVFFSTDTSPESISDSPTVHNAPSSNVGLSDLPAPLQPKSFVSWGRGIVSP